MSYEITEYTKKRARELGVTVKPSTNSKKKIDVFKQSKKIASIGAAGMMDFPWYVKTRGVEYAQERRRLYKIRHKKDINVVGSPGWLANKLLW
jgi:hypothetical protein